MVPVTRSVLSLPSPVLSMTLNYQLISKLLGSMIDEGL